jgi:RNA polymerase sigma-70 factor (ECF subfamily)
LSEPPLIQQYLQFRSEFMGYLFAITRDPDLSEEIYQNAAVVVMEQAGKTETIRDFRAWAKEVVRRQAFHAIRNREKASKFTRVVSPELIDVVSIAFLEDQTEAVNSESAALKECLNGLPADKRVLLTLRYESGASFDSIAKQLNSTPAAIQRALSRVRKLLHGCISKKLRLAGEVS